MECTDRSGIVQIHVAGDRVEVPVLPTEIGIRIYTWGLAADVAEKLRSHEDPAVEKSMSSRLLLQSACVLIPPVFSSIVIFNVIRIATDVAVWPTIDRLVVDILEHLHALMHRFNRDEIVLRWRVRARIPHREYKTQRPGAKQSREIGVSVHALR